MNIHDWLQANNHLARIAELVAVNYGNSKIEGKIGQPIPSTENRYGRLGLNIQEAFELQYYRGILDGFINSSLEPVKMAQEVQVTIFDEINGNLIKIPSKEQQKELLK